MYYLKKAFKCLILLCATKPDCTGKLFSIDATLFKIAYKIVIKNNFFSGGGEVDSSRFFDSWVKLAVLKSN